ncbi:hypothetical protein SPHINGO391_500234 [Sphingomonas aurantiaca]|uniref:Uncharacterized protein n=1 Tax=Sphingomonas aurantiaca TaxID=185949 RepID=A0A5E8AB90_9SPHN|nr:hypothetical protein SPHINGO391_500234 [Sphingomonas aurantiaca]
MQLIGLSQQSPVATHSRTYRYRLWVEEPRPSPQ